MSFVICFVIKLKRKSNNQAFKPKANKYLIFNNIFYGCMMSQELGKPVNYSLGRKCHDSYKNLKFLSVALENGRRAARCLVCFNTLKNTAIARLQTHR